MKAQSDGLLKTLLASFLAVTPHNGVCCLLLHRMNTYERSSLNLTTINDILKVVLNGKGTTSFDQRQAVVKFCKRKDPRNSQPDVKLFRNRAYTKNFFRNSAGCL